LDALYPTSPDVLAGSAVLARISSVEKHEMGLARNCHEIRGWGLRSHFFAKKIGTALSSHTRREEILGAAKGEAAKKGQGAFHFTGAGQAFVSFFTARLAPGPAFSLGSRLHAIDHHPNLQ
jgi:hypothetical protein